MCHGDLGTSPHIGILWQLPDNHDNDDDQPHRHVSRMRVPADVFGHTTTVVAGDGIGSFESGQFVAMVATATREGKREQQQQPPTWQRRRRIGGVPETSTAGRQSRFVVDCGDRRR